MIIQSVKFKSALSEAEIQQVMEERAPQFRALPGLLQKYYLRDIQTGEVGAVYIWDSEESLRTYRQSDLARTIASAYKNISFLNYSTCCQPLLSTKMGKRSPQITRARSSAESTRRGPDRLRYWLPSIA